MLRFSIIVCTYNRDRYIYDALTNLAHNDFPKDGYEIVLVNNISTDNTETECFRFKHDNQDVDFKYVVEYNQGLSYARNRGIDEANGEFLIFLDDDSFVSDTYLRTLDDYLSEYENTAAFGGRIEPLYEDGCEPEWMSRWTYSWVSAIDMGKRVVLFSGNKYPIGANMGFRADVIEKYGCFNVDLGRSRGNLMAGEEKDLFNRLKAAGEKIYYFPNIKVQHVIPPKRTTLDYIKRMGHGVGMSERIRCLSEGRTALLVRGVGELIKWGVSVLLCIYYVCTLRGAKGYPLLLFRWQVTKGLFEKETVHYGKLQG